MRRPSVPRHSMARRASPGPMRLAKSSLRSSTAGPRSWASISCSRPPSSSLRCHSTMGPWARGCTGSTATFFARSRSALAPAKSFSGRLQNQDRPLLPSPGQRAAVGFGRNIRPLNVYTDSDEVIRRVPLRFVVDGQPVTSMAAELAARASDVTAASAKQPTSGLVPNTITLELCGWRRRHSDLFIRRPERLRRKGGQGLLP